MKRHKLRTVLTIFSIIVAFILFGLLAAIKNALIGGVEYTGADRLIVRHKVSIIQLLPTSYQQRILRIPGVVASAYQNWFGGYYQDPKNFFFQSPVDPEEFLDMFPEFILPPEQKKAWLETRTGAIVGRASAEKFKWKIGDRVPIISQIWSHDDNQTWEFDIVGIYDGKEKGTDTTSMFFRYDYFDEARDDWGKGQIGWFSVRVSDPAKAAEVAALIDKEFENSPAETKTEPEGAFAQSFVKQIGNIALITTSILAAVFFTILLVTGNTIAQGVRERTGEIGVMKAIGFTRRQIMGLVLAESCTMSIIGGSVGMALAWIFAAQGDPTNGMLPLFFFPTRDVIIGVVLMIALGLVTGVFPALQAMRLRVADALRRL